MPKWDKTTKVNWCIFIDSLKPGIIRCGIKQSHFFLFCSDIQQSLRVS